MFVSACPRKSLKILLLNNFGSKNLVISQAGKRRIETTMRKTLQNYFIFLEAIE